MSPFASRRASVHSRPHHSSAALISADPAHVIGCDTGGMAGVCRLCWLCGSTILGAHSWSCLARCGGPLLDVLHRDCPLLPCVCVPGWRHSCSGFRQEHVSRAARLEQRPLLCLAGRAGGSACVAAAAFLSERGALETHGSAVCPCMAVHRAALRASLDGRPHDQRNCLGSRPGH